MKCVIGDEGASYVALLCKLIFMIVELSSISLNNAESGKRWAIICAALLNLGQDFYLFLNTLSPFLRASTNNYKGENSSNMSSGSVSHRINV